MNVLSSILKWIGTQLTPTQVTHSITRSSGATLNSNTKFVKCGKIVNAQLGVNVYSTEVAAGGNIFVGTLNTPSLLPAGSARFTTYLGQRILVGNINPSGNIIIRNSSSTPLTITSELILVGIYMTE